MYLAPLLVVSVSAWLVSYQHQRYFAGTGKSAGECSHQIPDLKYNERVCFSEILAYLFTVTLLEVAAMGFIAIGFIIGLVSGYTYSLPPIRRMFCHDCSEDTRREKFILQRIVLKKIVLCKERLLGSKSENDGFKLNERNDDEVEQSIEQGLLQSCCAICWSAYRDGDMACFSPNRLCKHAYHVDCVMPWFLERKRNDCPLCRRNFLMHTL